MKPITKNTLLISAVLCGSLALLSAGLYLRAMNGDTSAESTELSQDMPEAEITTQEMFVDEDMDQEISDEELAAIIAEISGKDALDMGLEVETEGIEEIE